MKFSDAKLPNCNPPPLLGQHSSEILNELGYDEHQIKALRISGVI
jgi:crotonobetainyl-CoA:carnitine CoA-transferase CaiB-like acyl-CoA transferase